MIQAVTSNYNGNKCNCQSALFPLKYLQVRNRNLRFGTIMLLYGSKDPSLRDELTRFDDYGRGASLIGQGLFSKVYKLDKFPYVFKAQQADRFKKLYEEMINLSSIPSTISEAQGFVSLAESSKGLYYLVSTFLSGKEVHPVKNPFSRGHLNNLFKDLSALDKAGVYHGDLSPSNILLTMDGKVHLIDYEYGSFVEESRIFEANNHQNHPSFIFLSNASMLEEATLPKYIKYSQTSAKAYSFFEEYLRSKSKYHQERASYIHSKRANWPYQSEIPIIEKAASFERAQANVFSNPSKEVLEVEAAKIHYLNAFRDASTAIDPNLGTNNPLDAPSAYLYALASIQRFNQTLKLLKPSVNSDLKTYVDIQSEVGNYWLLQMQQWSKDVFRFVLNDNLCKPPLRRQDSSGVKYELGKKFDAIDYDLDEHYQTSDITEKLGFQNRHDEFYVKFSENQAHQNSLKIIGREIHKIKSHQAYDVPDVVRQNFSKLTASFEKLAYSVENNRAFEIISSALSLLQCSWMLDKALEKHPTFKCSKQYKELSESVRSQVPPMTTSIFNSTVDSIVNGWAQKPNSIFGYNNCIAYYPPILSLLDQRRIGAHYYQ